MNHIYKLVWNRARNMYMAVSEMAKSHGKSGSISRAGRKTAAILLAVLALTAGVGTVSLAAAPKEALIKSLFAFILEFLCNARNGLTRIASYLRKPMTKQCIKILIKENSMN